ncbi:MAG: glycosyltransferase [Pseudomonadota bacterium]
MRVVLWVQHLLGTGHTVRAAAIGRALAAKGASVRMLLGAPPPSQVNFDGIEVLELPAVHATDGSFQRIETQDGADYATVADERASRILSVIEEVRPNILLTETFPFGRRKFAGELMPSIEAARAMGSVVAASVRDVLVRKPPPKERWMADMALRHFHRVLVHGDERFATLGESFGLASEVSELIRYTGYAEAGPVPESAENRLGVVVSAGGSGVGERLVKTAIEAAALGPADVPWRILVSKKLEHHLPAWRANAPAHSVLEPNRPDFRAVLASAALSVSQAGYNTVLDALLAGPRMILVPFAVHEETEQTDRAAALAARGLARVLSEAVLSPKALASAVKNALREPLPRTPTIDINGARRSAEILFADAR